MGNDQEEQLIRMFRRIANCEDRRFILHLVAEIEADQPGRKPSLKLVVSNVSSRGTEFNGGRSSL